MRIRQVRPEFFSDPVMASLAPEVRLTYVGLWCVADDAGWLRWDVAHLGAVLFPFESTKRRERHLTTAGEELQRTGRMVLLPCGCAQIPTLTHHQKIGGNKSFTARDDHDKHLSVRVHTDTDVYPGKVSNGKVSNVTVDARESANGEEPTEFRLRVPRPFAAKAAN